MRFHKKERILLAVADGQLHPLSDVPDEVFSQGLLGIGFAVDPTAGTVYSPADGRIQSVTDSRHAVTILTDDGLELLVHVGIDTVSLGGEGFLLMVSEGDRIRAGEVLLRVDLDLLRERGFSCMIPVVITNPELLKKTEFTHTKALGGKSEAARYTLT